VKIAVWEAPQVRTSINTRGVYTPGRWSTIVVELYNSGNVPATGLPLVIDGLPEGSELVPKFPMMGLPGPAGPRDFPLPQPPTPPGPAEPPLPPRPPEQPSDLGPSPEGPGVETTVIVVDKVPPKSSRKL